MVIDIKKRPKLKAKLEKWLLDLFGEAEDIDGFYVFQDAEDFICMVNGNSGYYIGSREVWEGDQVVKWHSRAGYVTHALNKQQFLDEKGFSTKFYRNDALRICGFTFVKARR